MSSNDRTPRRRTPPQPANPPTSDEGFFEEDVYYGGDWREDVSQEDEIIDHGQTASRPSATAAGLNRLRQSIDRSSASSAQRKPANRGANRPAQETPLPAADDRTRSNVGGSAARRQSAGTPQGRTQQQSRRQPEPVFEPEADYDPYAEYDDGFTEYDVPRRQSRPRTQVSMPSIKRPTMPSAIAQADLVNDVPALSLIGASLISLVAMAVVVGNQASSLAPEFATHVSASGLLEDFRSETALWRLPLLSLAFTLMNMVIAWFTAPIDRFASRFVLAAALTVQIIAWVAVIRIL